MKKIKNIALLALLMSSSFFISCSNDSDNENSAEVLTGDYWPAAVGNQWILDQNGTEVSMKMIAKEGDYFKFDQFFGMGDGVSGTGSVSLKKVKGDYFFKIDEFSLDYGEGISGKMSGYEFIIFKDYLDINKTWTGNFTQTTSFNIEDFPPITMNIIYTGTILEKASSVTIGSSIYKDVVKFKFHQEAKIFGQPATNIITEYWIAKDVGVIKMISGATVSTLKSYVVKK